MESIIADRLEARRSCLNLKDTSKHRFETLRTAEKLLIEETSPDVEVKQSYQRILDWGIKRNDAVHQIVKLGSKNHTTNWARRYSDLRRTVERGEELARAISRKVAVLNKHDYKCRSDAKKRDSQTLNHAVSG